MVVHSVGSEPTLPYARLASIWQPADNIPIVKENSSSAVSSDRSAPKYMDSENAALGELALSPKVHRSALATHPLSC